MQRDTDLTFGEIHGSHDSFVQNIEQIIDTALVKSEEEAPIRLRFLTRPESARVGPENTDPACYQLTSPHEHKPRMRYISVSYCWNHNQSSEGLTLPDYHIQVEPGSQRRPISCPPLVFHRSMRFARWQRCSYVWIDQECIMQTDPTDVERHLKVMHRVYGQSRWTVAVLATPISDEYNLEALLKVTRTPGSPNGRDFEIATVVALNLLHTISKDRWFSRTWAFQEKYCATSLHLLIPIAGFKITSYFKQHLLGDEVDSSWDFCLPIKIVRKLLMRLRSGPSAAKIADHWNSKDGLSFRDTIENLGIWYHNVGQSIVGEGILDWFENSHLIHGAFAMLEICDNLVVADRISIFGNLCELPYRLLSNRLNDPQYSYSTCLLALLLANFFPGPQQRAEAIKRYAWHIRDHTLGSTLETELFAQAIDASDPEHISDVMQSGKTVGWGRFCAIFFIGSIVLLQFLTVFNVLLS
ncbi:uncharacterized protein CC84DRAFT_963665 [Paraphaeosphaeria sporulosa]|uniref:Heterokaryon incompatibility domain-containing protein n=1 Tax=Paraphaeosphaeria sporulosa TaxID=1460663 RepID=A0A177C8Y5_9PLEO|nr:uncharacterized protein CC84DRAFT_963665 [Paraphaeosphaeria sporulosa]OAG03238.1 hypothetical protein CC84DRAFT_963665 [Paraphaeosphaeria sporulosa]